MVITAFIRSYRNCVQIAGKTAVIADGNETIIFRVTFKILNALKKCAYPPLGILFVG